MTKKFTKTLTRIITLATILGLIILPIQVSNVLATSRLTSASDTLSRTQASGTGAPTSGYTQSAQSVTDDFVIVAAGNDMICLDTDGTPSFNAGCTGTGNVTSSLITNGGLVSGSHYTGDQIAGGIATALAAKDGDADDSYTITYDESSDLFSIRADGGNTLNIALGWLTYTGSDSVATTLGYTANDSAIRDATATSDSAVAFNVRTGYNDSFSISVDQETAVAVTLDAGVYTTSTLVIEMHDEIESVSTHTVVVSYASDKFIITSDGTGAAAAIVVTEGTNDFLRTVRLNGDVPVDGAESAGIISANHTVQFTLADAIAAGDNIKITFPSGFDLTGIDFEDIDLADDGTDIALAASATGTTWGVGVAGQAITLTSDTGTMAAGSVVIIEIGRNATYGVDGTEQIANPTTTGLHEITLEVRTSSTVDQDAKITVFIFPFEAVTVQATIDPYLSFSIQGGYLLNFGTLEPNGYHKLGGAKTAYGSITLTGVTINHSRDTQTITVQGKVYELSDDGVASGSNIPVLIVDNENNYLTAVQVAANLYRAINNNDGDLVRANIDAGTNTVVDVVAISSGTAGNGYTLATTVTGAGVSGANFTAGVVGYNNLATSTAYAAGADVGNSQTGTNLVLSTNSAGGYVVTVKNTDTGVGTSGLTNGTTNIAAWTTGAYGYGLLASAQSSRYGNGTSNIIASAFQGDGTGDLPEGMSTTASTLASYIGTVANDNIAVEYNVRIDANQPAGQYSDTVTYIATATY